MRQVRRKFPEFSLGVPRRALGRVWLAFMLVFVLRGEADRRSSAREDARVGATEPRLLRGCLFPCCTGAALCKSYVVQLIAHLYVMHRIQETWHTISSLITLI